MYTTRPLFTRRPVANYREIIKSRLKHWRKLANMSQAQAAKLAGVARSTWQTWEDPARGALPDLAALAAVADGCRIEPGAALEWLVTDRAGAALMLAGLMAEGETLLSDPSGHIERGYQNLPEKLRLLGADIERLDDYPV